MRSRSTIVIPAFNRALLTARCLEAVAVSVPGGRVVVVDDGSTDGMAELLAGRGGEIRVVRHEVNRGFGVSCNDGAAVAESDYVVFLNNDTIPQAGWLKGLEDYAESHPQAAVVGSRLVYPDHTIQHAGVVICQDRYPRHLYTGFPGDHAAACRSRRFQIVTAACMLVRRDVFEEMNGFDPAFRNGFEDVDFCLRLGARGHEIHYCSDSVVVHLESVSPGRFKSDRENVALYRERWRGRVQPDDLRYYVEDGLLKLDYEGRYPVGIEVSPLLAVVDGAKRMTEVERLLRKRGRQVAELLRENTRLGLELEAKSPDSPELEYRGLRRKVREAVRRVVPDGATVLVISKGDGGLLEMGGRRAWHFPQGPGGVFAGHHPADSGEAIAHLEALRARGAEYLVIPATSLWWLDHYEEFRAHLETRYICLERLDQTCIIVGLGGGGRRGTAS